MLTIESLKAKQDILQLRDMHSYLVPETITYSFWNLGCPSNTAEPGGKLLHNTGSPAFTDNEHEIKPHKNERPQGKKAFRLPSEGGLVSANPARP